MNKKSFFITAVLVFVFASAVFGQPWDGNGVEGDPYQIWDANDMQAIGADANYWNAHFLLMADIDLSGYMGTSFNIIGIDYYNPFTGIFDGNGHTISNFTCDSNGTNYIGVFGHINDLNAEVKDLGLITPDVNAGNGGYVGALVGCLRQGRISGCYAEGGSISGGYYTGGLVGDSSISGVISNSYSAASVTGNSYVGGLIGWGGAISYCYSTGSVLGTTNVGGLVGYGTRVALESYWDIETSGVDYSATGTGLNTVQMQSLSTFLAGGWGGCGNEGEWTIDDGNDYPHLAWEGQAGVVISGELVDLLEGIGTAGEPYLIYNASELNMIGFFPCEWSGCFKLMADIDLSAYTGRSFNIIGGWTNPFTGVFDGNGHTISHFTYDSIATSCFGIFGYVYDPNSEIKDLGLIDPNVSAGAGDRVGALVGFLGEGSVMGCYVEGGSVTGGDYVGGLVGDNGFGDIQGCYSTANVTGYNNSIGGLVGRNQERGITNCYSTSKVTGEGDVGGLVGYNHVGDITNCYSTGSVTGDENVGGLVGYSFRVALGSYWDIETSGADYSATGTGLTTAQMQSLSTFLEGGWGGCGNGGSWTIDDGNDYPRLAWEGQAGVVISGELSDLLNGTGTLEEPYLIHNASELNMIGAFPCEFSGCFKLMADIDLGGYTGTNFNIIGGWMNPFTGVFDGNGHTISNFTYDLSTTSYSGIFGYVYDPNAEIRNLGLIEPDVNAGNGSYVGALVGCLRSGSVSSCYVEGGSVTGNYYVGGLIGLNYGDIKECYSTGSVVGIEDVGGLAGMNDGNIQESYSVGGVTGEFEIGGLAGTNDGNIQGCYSTGDITGNSYVGGLVGYGHGHGSISGCYSTGVVSGGSYVGGLAGYNYKDISNCYSAGDVTGGNYTGGLVGYNREVIYYCYSTGSVAGDSNVGGLVGYDYNLYSDYTASFWDSDVNPDVNGIGNIDEPNVVGLPTVLMQTESTFTDAGWDFVGEVINGPNDIWDICEGTNYPKLVWSIPAGDFMCPDGVDMVDFAILGEAWMSEAGDLNWEAGCDISEPEDEVIDGLDLAVFVGNWLEGV